MEEKLIPDLSDATRLARDLDIVHVILAHSSALTCNYLRIVFGHLIEKKRIGLHSTFHTRSGYQWLFTLRMSLMQQYCVAGSTLRLAEEYGRALEVYCTTVGNDTVKRAEKMGRLIAHSPFSFLVMKAAASNGKCGDSLVRILLGESTFLRTGWEFDRVLLRHGLLSSIRSGNHRALAYLLSHWKDPFKTFGPEDVAHAVDGKSVETTRTLVHHAIIYYQSNPIHRKHLATELWNAVGRTSDALSVRRLDDANVVNTSDTWCLYSSDRGFIRNHLTAENIEHLREILRSRPKEALQLSEEALEYLLQHKDPNLGLFSFFFDALKQIVRRREPNLDLPSLFYEALRSNRKKFIANHWKEFKEYGGLDCCDLYTPETSDGLRSLVEIAGDVLRGLPIVATTPRVHSRRRELIRDSGNRGRQVLNLCLRHSCEPLPVIEKDEVASLLLNAPEALAAHAEQWKSPWLIDALDSLGWKGPRAVQWLLATTARKGFTVGRSCSSRRLPFYPGKRILKEFIVVLTELDALCKDQRGLRDPSFIGIGTKGMCSIVFHGLVKICWDITHLCFDERGVSRFLIRVWNTWDWSGSEKHGPPAASFEDTNVANLCREFVKGFPSFNVDKPGREGE